MRTPRPARWPRWVSSRLRDRPRPRWLGGDRDRQYFGLVRRHARHRKADDLAPHPAGDAPACCARSAWSRIRLRPSRGETRRRATAARRGASRKVAGSTTAGAAAPPVRTSHADHDAGGCGGFWQQVLWRLGVGRAQIIRPGRRGVRTDRGPEPRHPGNVGRRLRIDLERRRRIRRPAVGENVRRHCRPDSGAPNRDASSASSIGATRGRISEPPLPLTT